MDSGYKKILDMLVSYNSLGYDVYFTNTFGKNSIVMKKRYSYLAEKSLFSQQIFKDYYNVDRMNNVLTHMYKDIENQEKSGNYRDLLDS